LAFFGYNDPEDVEDTIYGTGTVYYQYLTTMPETFGTLNRKFMSRASLLFEGVFTSSGNPILLWSDMVGQWQTGVTMSGNPNDSAGIKEWAFPFVTQLGSFRQRQFQVRFYQGQARWGALEVDINKGQR
jgi:hypothetical protein